MTSSAWKIYLTLIKAFSSKAWAHYLEWQKTDKKMLKRIHLLIKEIERTPSEGIGKPEALKHNLAGWWSRRIDDEHRIVYRVKGGVLNILSLRYHYQKTEDHDWR